MNLIRAFLQTLLLFPSSLQAAPRAGYTLFWIAGFEIHDFS